MATYRLSVQMISRSAGRSALAASAYRSGTKLGDHDFQEKGDVVFSGILLPDGAPAWMGEREKLWTSVANSERRSDSQEAREVQVALPREVGAEERIALAVRFAREAFVSLGMVADVAVHESTARDGSVQPHAHYLLSLRRVEDGDGFARTKERAWNSKALLVEWRAAWADHVNTALERAGVAEGVDHRTLEAQCREAVAAGDFGRAAEVDHEPEPKVGWRAWALERGGIATERGALWREVTARTEESRGLYETVAEFGTTAKARFLEVRAGCQDVFQAFMAWGEEQAAGLAALARGAALAGAVGTVALGAGLARDTPEPGPGLEQEGDTMSDEELDRMIGEMMVEDRALVVAEAQAAEREEREAAAGAGGEAGRPGMVAADEGWGRPEREAEVEVDPAAAWSMALSGGDWPGAEKAEGEAEADGKGADRESAGGEEPEAQQADGEVEEADPELDRLLGELEAEDRAMGEREIGGEELEAGG